MNREPKAIIESILFASGESVPAKRISEVMNLPENEVTKLLWELKDEYDSNPERGIHIIQLEDNYQLCTKREFYDYIRTLREKNRRASLTNAGLEVLSVVAYNQPVTRGTIEFIRGVNSDGPLNNLISAGLVKEVGRLDAPGRPILFGTTEDFLRCFNIPSLSELPEVDFEQLPEGLSSELGKLPVTAQEQSKDQINIFEYEQGNNNLSIFETSEAQSIISENSDAGMTDIQNKDD